MDNHPINRLLDAVKFTEIQREEQPQEGALYATHEGVLVIGTFQFKVYQLNNGERVLDAKDVEQFFASQ